MSTNYRTLEKIDAADVLDGRLETFGVRQQFTDDTTATVKCLTDGRNYLWMYVDEEGFVTLLTRYGRNAPSKILRVIATTFDTDIVSEYEPQYWGFESQEEWDASIREISRQHEDEFYAELIKFVSGQPADIPEEGTVGWTQAQIAKQLVKDDPRLTLSEERKRFMSTIETIYDRDHAIKITLTDRDLALAKMIATHEDDMGQA
jgi:hypothetical protein